MFLWTAATSQTLSREARESVKSLLLHPIRTASEQPNMSLSKQFKLVSVLPSPFPRGAKVVDKHELESIADFCDGITKEQ